MTTIPGYDAWKLSPPPEPTPDPDARLDDEAENADYPPCPTCGKALPTVDREFYSPAEAIDMYINCTPCEEEGQP